MLVCVDHGNKQIKTASRVFTSGLVESDTRPPFGDNILFYRGKYYTLSDQRIPYTRDKTEDDRFFILTLFAIAIAVLGLVELGLMCAPMHKLTHAQRLELERLEREVSPD